MSNSIRFLGFAVLAWAGVRAASLAFYPGSTTASVPTARAAAMLPPVAQTQFDLPPPPDPSQQPVYYPGQPPGYGMAYPGQYPASYRRPMAAIRTATGQSSFPPVGQQGRRRATVRATVGPGSCRAHSLITHRYGPIRGPIARSFPLRPWHRPAESAARSQRHRPGRRASTGFSSPPGHYFGEPGAAPSRALRWPAAGRSEEARPEPG